MATPFFLHTSRGQLFALYYPPQSEKPDALVVHVPAFAEEMNKSRRMVTLQSLEFSTNNIGVLVVDLFGTGDSEGLLEDSTREVWLDDLDVAVDWLTQQYANTPLYLWGLRFGCALAIDYAARTQTGVNGLVLWSPLLSARMMLTQFLRLRVASALTSQSAGDIAAETTKDLFHQLEYGIAVEVAGYMISPDLCASLLDLEAAKLSFQSSQTICWLDFVTGEPAQPSAVNRKAINHWQQLGHSVEWKAVNGDRFWTTQEIAVCPELIRTTTQMLSTARS